MCLVYVQFVCVCTQKKPGRGGGVCMYSDFPLKRVEKIQEKSSEAVPLKCG
jgi:hypothetical protein